MKQIKFFLSVFLCITVTFITLQSFTTNKDYKVKQSTEQVVFTVNEVQVAPTTYHVLTPLYFVHYRQTATNYQPTANALNFGKITYKNKVPAPERTADRL